LSTRFSWDNKPQAQTQALPNPVTSTFADTLYLQ